MILVVIVVALFWANYIPGTWLSGWDTLHPEFDFELYFNRVFFGAWQEHQGVGAPASQAHAAELPRLALLWLMSWMMPLSALRYAFLFVCLGLGVLGMYWLMSRMVLSGNKNRREIGFLVGLVYLCNLTVVQQFYVPLEMFLVHYASLPWIGWSIWGYLKRGDKKSLWWLVLVSLLSGSMAHTATLFYVMVGAIGLLLLAWSLFNGWVGIKRSFVAMLVLLGMNLYWLLPNVYFIVNHGSDVGISRIHANFSEEAFLQGKSFGTWTDLVLQRNFLFNWREFNTDEGEFVDLLDEWSIHLFDNSLLLAAPWFVFGVALVGIGFSLIKRNRLGLGLLPMFGLSVFFWINANPPFEQLFDFLRSNSSLLKEGLRFPFTKFSILYLFSLSVFFGLGLSKLFGKIGNKVAKVFVVGAMSIVLLGYFLPAFEGNLVSPSMKVEFPNEYLEAFDWFEQQGENMRIAKLPLHSFWGWNFYDWDYQGAGFTWFGLPQPSLDREFDRWTPYNESFYNQLSFAAYSKDLHMFEETLKKYQVGYLLLDESQINAGGDSELLMVDGLKQMMGESSDIEFEKSFGFLSVYKTNFVKNENFVWALNDYQEINSDLTYIEYDSVYKNVGDYVQRNGGDIYPFANFDPRRGIEMEFGDGKLSLKRETGPLGSGVKLVLPDFVQSEEDLPLDVLVAVDGSGGLRLQYGINSPEFVFNGGEQIEGSRTWLSEDFDVSASEVGFVSVGGKAFDIRSEELSLEWKKIGSVLVAKDDWVEVGLYSREAVENNQVVEGLLEVNPRLCVNPDRQLEKESVRYGEFTLEVKDASVCLGQRFDLESDSLVDVSFAVKSKEGVYPWFCVTRVGDSGCVNDVVPNEFVDVVSMRQFEFLLPINNGSYWLDFVAQADEGQTGSISYSNLAFDSYSKLSIEQVNFGELFERVSKEQEVVLDFDVKSVAAVVNQGGGVVEDFTLGRGNFEPVNCDLDKRGEVDKKLLLGGSLDYRASENGSSCDFFDYAKLSQSKSYLLRMKGVNEEGRGLKIYLHNKDTKRMDLERILSNGDFDDWFLVLSKPGNVRGYTLNVETASFGRVESENILEEISFWPVPAKWLSEVKLVGGAEDRDVGDLVVKGVNKLGKSNYSVQVEGKSGVLVLGQGYNRGWLGYQINSKNQNSKPKTVQNWMPWFFGDRLEKVKVNNWANGWVVERSDSSLDSSQLKSDQNDKQYEIVLVYWPQYLEFGGLILVGIVLFGSVVWLVRFRRIR